MATRGQRDKPIRRLRTARGLTLIEMLIAVSILAILAALVVPQMNGDNLQQLKSTAQAVAADMAYGRNLAVVNNSKYRFNFDTVQNRYVLVHSGSNPQLNTLPDSPLKRGDDPADKQTLDLDDLPYVGAAVELVAVHRVAGSSTPVSNVEFGPLGETTRSEETVIWLGCGEGDQRRYLPIHIDPVSGLASIGDYQATSP